jgi:hypothetical protein
MRLLPVRIPVDRREIAAGTFSSHSQPNRECDGVALGLFHRNAEISRHCPRRQHILRRLAVHVRVQPARPPAFWIVSPIPRTSPCQASYYILLHDFFMPAPRSRFRQSPGALQRDLDTFVAAYNSERNFPGANGPGRSPLRAFLDAIKA